MIPCSFVALFVSIHLLFTPIASGQKVFFLETFDEVDPFQSGKWLKSEETKYSNQPIVIQPPTHPPAGFENDKGILLSQEMKYYGFSAPFSEPIGMKEGNEFVVQYELKLEETLSCGGAYIKLLRSNKQTGKDIDFKKLNNESPYTIMFGPDRCGNNNKVHFILQHENPLTKVWEEKHFNETIPIRSDKKTHLYTLQIKENNDFTIYIDMKEADKGNLLAHMNPSINPPKLIDDPTDKKPEDWVDDEFIPDPAAQKPDDWDEDAPKQILDTAAVKPEGWADDAPKTIPDPSAVKPEDWDDDEDGEWEAPLIPNPICHEIGCGEWKQPMIPNRAYKGKWSPPQIKNPAYKGVWAPKQISNPDFFVDEKPVLTMTPMIGLAVEIWTTNAGIFFDNFLVATSLSDAFEYAEKTFKLKSTIEQKEEKKDKKANASKERVEKRKNGGIREQVEVLVAELFDFVADTNPIVVVVTMVGLPAILLLLFFYGLPKRQSKKQSASADTTTESASSETNAPEDEDEKEDDKVETSDNNPTK